MLFRTLPLLAAVLVLATPYVSSAQLRARLLASGFNRPIAVVFDPVVPGGILVVDQAGLVRAFLNGVERPTPFLDLRTAISGGNDERGLLGLAIPPDGATSRRVFVNFTNASGHTVVARFTRSAADPLVADAASRFDLQWPGPNNTRQGFITQDFANHNGGHLAFGPDGYLYVGMGDGGSGDDPNNRAQSPNTLLGKMLRIDVSGTSANGYTIPASNPVFATMTPTLPEVWAFGLRNPWRYSFDDLGPGATNALIVADVGQGEREEINIELPDQGGRNYGWRIYEGTLENDRVAQLGPAFLPLQAPNFEYSHMVGQAVTGGFVYRGTALGAAYRGRYFYADCPTGKIFSLAWSVNGSVVEAGTNTDHTAELGGPFRCIGSFARDGAGELYFMDFGYSASNTGRIYRLELAPASPPNPPTNLAASVTGATVALSWTPPATGGAPTGYVLEAGSALGLLDITTAPTIAPTLTAQNVPTGQYFVRVRATNATGRSVPTPDLIVTVGCTAPAAPTTFTATTTGRTVTLAWNVASGTTQTTVEAGYSPGATALTFPSAAPAAGASFANVPPGTYYVRTRARNACGVGPTSVERTVVVQ